MKYLTARKFNLIDLCVFGYAGIFFWKSEYLAWIITILVGTLISVIAESYWRCSETR